MLKSISKLVQIIAFTMIAGAVVVGSFYLGYILAFLCVLTILFGVGYLIAHWDEVVAWAEED